MVKKENKIYLDQEGYDKFLKNIEDLKRKLNENNMKRKTAFDAGSSDGCNSTEFEEIKRTEELIAGELQRQYDLQSRIVIIEKHNDTEIIDIGDVVTVDITTPDNNNRNERTFKLVGMRDNSKAETQEISINSPLGNSIYKKKVGDNCYYSVNNRVFFVSIKEKLNLSDQKSSPAKQFIKSSKN